MAAAVTPIELRTHIDTVHFTTKSAAELRDIMPGLDTSAWQSCEAVVVRCTDVLDNHEEFVILARRIPKKLRKSFEALVGRSIAKSTRKLLPDVTQLGSTPIKDLTPYEALVLLHRNWLNREWDVARVAIYTAEITSDYWLMSSQGIGIDWLGVIVDGQHRLLACLFSGRPFPIVITTGLDPRVRSKIDLNKGRDPKVMLDMLGETDLPRGTTTVGILETIFTAHCGSPSRMRGWEVVFETKELYTDHLRWLQSWITRLSSMEKTESLAPIVRVLKDRRAATRAALVVAHMAYPEKTDELLTRIVNNNTSGDTTLETVRSYIGHSTKDDALTVFYKILVGCLRYVHGESVVKLPHLIEQRPKAGVKLLKQHRRCASMFDTLLEFWRQEPLLPATAIALLPQGKAYPKWPTQ